MTRDSTVGDVHRRHELNCTDEVAEERRLAYIDRLPALACTAATQVAS
jgi:hypothetical protein